MSSSTPPQHDLSSLRIDDRSRPASKAGRRLGLFAAAVGALLLLGSLSLAFRSQKPVVEVGTARPASGAKAGALLNASGYITPRRRATVAGKVTGRGEETFAEEGRHVECGQV